MKKKVRKVEKEEIPEDKKEEVKDSFEIIPREDISKMTIEEAIEIGVLPTPIELAKDTSEIVQYGKSAGGLYGQAMASLASALKRKDLPYNVRLAKGMRALTFLFSMLLSGLESFEKITAIEEEILSKKIKEEKSESEESEIERLLDILEESGFIKAEDKEAVRKKLKSD